MTAGLGFSDMTVGTNGSKGKSQVIPGIKLAIGTEVDFNNGWSGVIETGINVSKAFNPVGGGGAATAGISTITLGIAKEF